MGKLVALSTSTTGVVMSVYERAGDFDHGSFAFENPTEDEVDRRRRLAEEGT